MKIRFQKDKLRFKEGASAKPCVSSSSETQTASHFERLCLVESKYSYSFIRNNDLLQKALQLPQGSNPHFPPVPNIIKDLSIKKRPQTLALPQPSCIIFSKNAPQKISAASLK